MFSDLDLELKPPAGRRHVRFRLETAPSGPRTRRCWPGDAAGDFSTMTFDERVRVVEAVLDTAGGAVPVAMEVQTTSTRELVRARPGGVGRGRRVHPGLVPLLLHPHLKAGELAAVQRALVTQAMPFYKLWVEIERTDTSGDGYLDERRMELVGLDSSRGRPPTRDFRRRYREPARRMLLECGVRHVVPA